MTIGEKREALERFCDNWGACNQNDERVCPLFDKLEDCFPDNPALVERNYNICYPQGEEAPCTNDNNNMVDHPNHYNRDGSMECIDEMVTVFGEEAVANFCLCNVWKYRYRASDKNGLEDLKKSDWYMNKYKELITNA